MSLGTIAVEREIGGRTLKIETGRIAKQAAGSVFVTYGETIVMVAVVTGTPREGIDFFPLTVDYREKTYAAGKFPGGFFKREARPTNKEILTMRLTDRPMRPLFPEGFRDEVLIQAMVLVHDQKNDPDILALIGASAAVSISPVPFNGPIAATRMGYIDGEYIVNPTTEQMDYTVLDAVIAGTKNAVNMLEIGAAQLSEEIVASAIEQGHKNNQVICEMIEELVGKAGKPKSWTPPPARDELKKQLEDKFSGKLREARKIKGKQERNETIKAIYTEAKETFCPEGEEDPQYTPGIVRDELDKIEEVIVARMVVEEGVRTDGRGPKDLRPIEGEVGILPRVHGSGFFQRGETQSLCVATLGTGRDEQIVDGLTEEYSKKFMLHYNFPPLCVGEVRRVGATSRREIGHGNLAEKALQYVLPTPDDFPYTIRLVSEIMESNGSSSMASVCAGCLALMDAGVPISQPVAGISVGMFEYNGKRQPVIDILGEEDHFGMMDFKVAGTGVGVTAVQVDLKASGVSQAAIVEAFAYAKEARLAILKNMLTVLAAPRKDTSKYAPRILTTKIHPEKIGKLIGPGGKNIKAIEAATGAKVEIDDDGTVHVACVDMKSAEQAMNMVEAITAEVKVGKIYAGRVSSIKDFGAFIEVTPGQDGLCHISELDNDYVKSVEDVVKIGDSVRVKVIAVDDQGRIKLSRKAAMAEEAEETASV